MRSWKHRRSKPGACFIKNKTVRLPPPSPYLPLPHPTAGPAVRARAPPALPVLGVCRQSCLALGPGTLLLGGRCPLAHVSTWVCDR